MQRFSSLKHVPAEARRILRDRFSRYLPSQHATTIHAAKGGRVTLSDELLLRLMQNLTIDFGSDIKSARATYIAALPPITSEPSLDDLMVDGWLRVVWGRISTPFEIAQVVRAAPAGAMTAFAAVVAKRFEQSYGLTDTARSDADLADVVAAIERKELTPLNIGCQTPQWVAARLWDRTQADFPDASAVLRVWFDRWYQLGCPSLVPNRVWSEVAADAFRKAAMDVLGSDPSLVGWEDTRAGFVKQIALASRQPTSSAEGYVPPIPDTLVDRALWFNNHSLERAVMGTLGEYDSLFGLVRLMLADVEAEDNAPAPHRVAARLIELATDRPEIFLILLFKVRQNSALLADLLLYPATSALACLLIAQWQLPSSAWDRELGTRDDQTTKAIALADAVSVMGDFLEQGSVAPKEAASLLVWFHGTARPGFSDILGSGELALRTLCDELARQSTETLRTMVAALSSSTAKLGLGTSTFAAALDIIDAGKLASEIDPAPLVDGYIRSIAAGNYTLSVHRVSVGGAASLVELATRTAPARHHEFMHPIDVKARTAAGEAAKENPYSVIDTIARSIRAHVRILSRAVAGWVASIPDDLIQALIDTVRAGALSHAEKGRVAAFSARFNTDVFRDRPIAADLGVALGALAGDHRERLLGAVLEIDEPLVLAQLLSFAPQAARARIEQRLAAFTPSDAGDIRSLTEAQARIEELLSAGLGETAARFIEAEQGLKTLGNVAGREMMRLRATLRLQLLRHDWAGIANAAPSSLLNAVERPAALETIDFYKALAALNNPNGDREAAEHMFATLQRRRPDVAAYAIDLFAARVSHLLEGDAFGPLRGSASVRARQVLVEAEQMMRLVRGASESDEEIFNCNKALLLLALGQPAQANELLVSVHASRLRDSVAAYNAIALDRMGRARKALAVLDEAKEMLGDSDIVRAARAHIQVGKAFAASANVSSTDDPILRMKAAFGDFSRMDPTQQAEVLHWPPEPFDEFVISHVRLAAASVTSLVPMMNRLGLDSCEDDLNAVIRELLIARFQLLGWSVPDQSKGGFTAAENPGERDLLLKKDSATLAAIEAVVCSPPPSYRKLTQHFQKLFAYSECRLFFHLTYASVPDLNPVFDHLRHAAEHDAPAGFEYRGSEEIPYTDSRPKGFFARYGVESDEVKVVFLILDMGQHRQIAAAKTAAAKGPRKKRGK